jgi:hypothetical protein
MLDHMSDVDSPVHRLNIHMAALGAWAMTRLGDEARSEGITSSWPWGKWIIRNKRESVQPDVLTSWRLLMYKSESNLQIEHRSARRANREHKVALLHVAADKIQLIVRNFRTCCIIMMVWVIVEDKSRSAAVIMDLALLQCAMVML